MKQFFKDFWKSIATKTGTALVVAIWFVVSLYFRVPKMEAQIEKQRSDIALLKASMVSLMLKTGNPPSQADLEKLFSSVTDVGESKEKVFVVKRVEGKVQDTSLPKWVPLENKREIQQSLGNIQVGANPSVQDVITGSVFTGKRAEWVVENASFRVNLSSAVIILSPKHRVSPEEMNEWVDNINQLNTQVQHLDYAIPKR